jgi:hypothetical protein
MRWVVAFFLALVSIPVAQVAADAWEGRPGPHVSVVFSHPVDGIDVAKTHHHRLYDPFAPWFPGKAKAG